MAFAYILKSMRDGKYYYGSAEDLKVRFKSHNSGKVRSTKTRRPLIIHYYEEVESKREAPST